LTEKLLNVHWNTPLGATGAADVGVGAGAGAGPGRGAGGAGGPSPIIAVYLFSPNPGNPGASEQIFYTTNILQLPISRRGAKNVIYPG